MARPFLLLTLACLACASGPAPSVSAAAPAPTQLPASGWSEDKQAVHVLNRLAYGPSPASLDEVRQMGVETWIQSQLHPDGVEDKAVDAKLANFRSLRSE